MVDSLKKTLTLSFTTKGSSISTEKLFSVINGCCAVLKNPDLEESCG